MMNRRQLLKATAFTSVLSFAPSSLLALGQAQPATAASGSGPFELPKLPYPSDALEPHIDARTMEIHHGKHHAAYVSNLNKALAGHPRLAKRKLEDLLMNLEDLPEEIRTTVRNNGGGHANHALFWQMLIPKKAVAPRGELARAIDKSFGSLGGFQEQFTKAATSVFGSGWAWLTVDGRRGSRELKIETTPNQDSPIMAGRVPLLGVDVWEHAYYLKYQNRRADYVAAFFNVINWDFVAGRFEG